MKCFGDKIFYSIKDISNLIVLCRFLSLPSLDLKASF